MQGDKGPSHGFQHRKHQTLFDSAIVPPLLCLPDWVAAIPVVRLLALIKPRRVMSKRDLLKSFLRDIHVHPLDPIIS
jgi:hypothetical protein